MMEAIEQKCLEWKGSLPFYSMFFGAGAADTWLSASARSAPPLVFLCAAHTLIFIISTQNSHCNSLKPKKQLPRWLWGKVETTEDDVGAEIHNILSLRCKLICCGSSCWYMDFYVPISHKYRKWMRETASLLLYATVLFNYEFSIISYLTDRRYHSVHKHSSVVVATNGVKLTHSDINGCATHTIKQASRLLFFSSVEPQNHCGFTLDSWTDVKNRQID